MRIHEPIAVRAFSIRFALHVNQVPPEKEVMFALRIKVKIFAALKVDEAGEIKEVFAEVFGI